MTPEEKKQLFRQVAERPFLPLMYIAFIAMMAIPISLILMFWLPLILCLKIFGTSVVLFFVFAFLHQVFKKVAHEAVDKYLEKENYIPKKSRFRQKMEEAMKKHEI